MEVFSETSRRTHGVNSSTLTKSTDAPIGDLYLRACFNPETSYGMHALRVVQDMEAMGVRVYVYPIGEHLPPGHTAAIEEAPWELLLAPLNTPVTHPKTIFFTMHESSLLSASQRLNVQRAKVVIVPSAWNSQVFSSSNALVNYTVPLGIDTTVFKPRLRALRPKLIFGTAGNFSGLGARKQPEKVVKAFLQAFPENPAVELWIKCHKTCPIPDYDDPRIKVFRDFFTPEQLADWYAELDFYVNASGGEGWGLMLQQAMAIGRPILGLAEGGPVSFGAPGPYTIIPESVYSDILYYSGRLFDITTDNLAALMIETESGMHGTSSVYKSACMQAAITALQFSWERSNARLWQVVQNCSPALAS